MKELEWKPWGPPHPHPSALLMPGQQRSLPGPWVGPFSEGPLTWRAELQGWEDAPPQQPELMPPTPTPQILWSNCPEPECPGEGVEAPVMQKKKGRLPSEPCRLLWDLFTWDQSWKSYICNKEATVTFHLSLLLHYSLSTMTKNWNLFLFPWKSSFYSLFSNRS